MSLVIVFYGVLIVNFFVLTYINLKILDNAQFLVILNCHHKKTTSKQS